MKEIGIFTHILDKDIYDPSARELLLFCVQLYQALPHYIPKATIEFPAVLGDTVTKNIELSNPSKQPIAYWVKIIGTEDFLIDTDAKIDPIAGKLERDSSGDNVSIRIEPGQTIPFPIRFKSRISKVVKGRIIFTNKREGNVQAAAMVFELASNVYERISIDVKQYSTKLYKLLPIDLPVDNIFTTDVNYSI